MQWRLLVTKKIISLNAVQAELQGRGSDAAGGQPSSARDTARTAATSRAGLPPLSPAPPSAAPDDVNVLLRQLQDAAAEVAEARASSEAATERERGLQAIVDGRGAGDQLVPHAVHAEVLHQNKVLAAQVQQLRSDLEVLYMDDLWRSNPDGMLEGTGTSGATPSAMNTVARLGALIGVSDSRTIMVRAAVLAFVQRGLHSCLVLLVTAVPHDESQVG